MIHQNRHKIIKLTSPDFSTSLKAGFNTGLRPYRNYGIRIEVEQIAGKVVVHNYGHGGAGVSLFFGSVKQAIEKFDSHCHRTNFKPASVTVIGSG